MNNLVEDTAHTIHRKRLTAAMADWQQKLKDATPFTAGKLSDPAFVPPSGKQP